VRCDASVNINRIPSNSTIFAAIEFIKFLDVLSVYLKVKHLNVRTYAIGVLRFRKRDKIMLQRPANEDVGWILAVLEGNASFVEK